jgi:hypothetical protein
MMFLTVIIALLTFTDPGLVDALKKQTVEILKIEGPQPMGLMRPQMSTIIPVETPDDSLWIFVNNEVWNFDKSKLTWKLREIIPFEDHFITGGYDPYHKNFLFWSSGIGKVFTWNFGQSKPTRIDHSDHHKTQFGHYAFVEPTSGNIFAFGGGGYWQARGYITKFDHEIKEWSIVPILDPSSYPRERMSAKGAYDTQYQQLHIFGGYTYEFSRSDISNNSIILHDYWVFDFKSSTWKEKNIFNKPASFEFYEGAFFHNYASLSKIDEKNRLIWHLVNTDKIGFLQLVVFDIERDFGVYLPVYFSATQDTNLEYDEDQNRLLIYGFNRISNIENSPLIQISSFNLPTAEQVRSIMDELRSSEIENAEFVSANVLYIASILLILLVLAWYFVRKRTKKQLRVDPIDSPIVVPHTLKTPSVDHGLVNLEIQFRGGILIQVNGENVTDTFTKPELDIFMWLFWKKTIGKPYQSTDIIEEVFWSDVQNQDYVRKQRNLSLRRLNSQLQEVFKDSLHRDDWVIDRNAYNDKRKKEYALNFDQVNVVTDLGGDSFKHGEILPDITYKWADQIRSEYAVWTAA